MTDHQEYAKSCMRPSHHETSPYNQPIFLIDHFIGVFGTRITELEWKGNELEKTE